MSHQDVQATVAVAVMDDKVPGSVDTGEVPSRIPLGVAELIPERLVVVERFPGPVHAVAQQRLSSRRLQKCQDSWAVLYLAKCAKHLATGNPSVMRT